MVVRGKPSSVLAFRLLDAGNARAFAIRIAEARSRWAPCRISCGMGFGAEAWRRSDRLPLLGSRCSAPRWGVAKPYPAADHWAGNEVLGLRLQALCRQALLGLLFWQLAWRMPHELMRGFTAVAAVHVGL